MEKRREEKRTGENPLVEPSAAPNICPSKRPVFPEEADDDDDDDDAAEG